MFVGLPTKIGKIFSWAPRPTKISSIFVGHSQTDEHKSIIFVGLLPADENKALTDHNRGPLIGLSAQFLSLAWQSLFAPPPARPPSPRHRPPDLRCRAAVVARPPSSLAATPPVLTRPRRCAPASRPRRSPSPLARRAALASRPSRPGPLQLRRRPPHCAPAPRRGTARPCSSGDTRPHCSAASPPPPPSAREPRAPALSTAVPRRSRTELRLAS